MNRILITGAGGFLGGQLASYFHRNGLNVVGTVHVAFCRTADWTWEKSSIGTEEFRSFLSDFRPDAIVHSAGGSSVPASIESPANDFINGPQLTFSLLNDIRESVPSAKIVFLSSAAVYGNPSVPLPVSESCPISPISPYGFHKMISESVVREHALIFGLRVASLRIFSAYGIGLRKQVVWDLCRKALKGAPLLVQGTGNETRDFVHADDICRAVDCLLRRASLTGECYNLGSGIETRIGEIADWVANAAACSQSVKFDSVVPRGMPAHWRADISQIESLGWKPQVVPKDGLCDFIHWCLAELRQPVALHS